MMADRLSISVVIPVFNEEKVLGDCLAALREQSDPVNEIIVVDNNCTDGSVALAAAHPEVRVVAETRKGISYARSAGFDAARGEIIARIDADTLVAPDWAATLRREFAEHADLAALAGGAGIAELSPRGRIWWRWYYRGFRFWHERSIGVAPMMYGFNGALRRNAWQQIRDMVTLGDAQISEDVDITIALLKSGLVVRYSDKLVVKARVFRSMKPGKMRQYYRTDGLTLAKHEFGNTRRWVTHA